MRPAQFAPMEKYAHGTRSRYVAGCRCGECRAANTRYARDLEARAKARAAELPPAQLAPAPQLWTAPDGTERTRIYRRACPGVNGNPCPTSSHLRKDSKGGCCGTCRKLLVWNGMVSAEKSRAHLAALSAQGVGYKSVGDACDVARTVLELIISGAKLKVRAETERRILGVDAGAAADGAIIDARPTWKLIREILRAGYTKAEIAERLGYESPALHLGRRRVLVRNAHAVEKLHREVLAELELAKTIGEICPDCGKSHAPENRLKAIAPMVEDGLTSAEIREAWTCFYGDGARGERALFRDLAVLRERRRAA